MRTYILEVNGVDEFEDHFAAQEFEQMNITVEEAFDIANEDEISGTYETKGIVFTAHTFGATDETFINWVSNSFMDEDTRKHHNFYLVDSDD